ncbi:hypothetical protein [Pseudomonas putida]
MTGLKLQNGTVVVRSEMLPQKTMYVSTDIYDLLTKGPEEDERQHAELMAKVDAFNALVKKVAR